MLLLAFNRPRLTAENLERILAARPERLYVAMDGPRPDVPGDAAACAEVRAAVAGVADRVSLVTDAAPRNLGLRARVVSALDWVLAEEESVVVLEDDCHPAPDFFPFMQAMLHRFAADERVGSVCGSTAVGLTRRGPRFDYDYHFSQVGLPWGWGTWRRAWRDYDRELMCWPELRRSGVLEQMMGPVAARQWRRMLDHADSYSSWWVRWLMSLWASGRLSVVPRVNLVANRGVGEAATHTRAGSVYARFAELPVGALPEVLRHPPYFARDPELDRITLEALLPWSDARRQLRKLVVEGPLALKYRLR
ncbi:MAG: hypothetical protein H6730_30170 [Deltaproteobacteria bacterium]|nr:hypothetical protein [Deltaproteobacteria bacterium]